jgi:hypothetical protein
MISLSPFLSPRFCLHGGGGPDFFGPGRWPIIKTFLDTLFFSLSVSCSIYMSSVFRAYTRGYGFDEKRISNTTSKQTQDEEHLFFFGLM